AELGIPRGGWPVSSDIRQRNRRSVYVFVKRNLRYPFFSAFDAPDSNETCARRHQSTSAPQALMLLNSKIVQELAQAFAARVLKEAGKEPAQVVERAYRLALGRAPDTRERDTLLTYLQDEVGLLHEEQGRKELSLPMPLVSSGDPAYGSAVANL